MVRRSPYIYGTKNCFPYSMWDITHVHFYLDNIGLAQKSGSIRVVNM